MDGYSTTRTKLLFSMLFSGMLIGFFINSEQSFADDCCETDACGVGCCEDGACGDGCCEDGACTDGCCETPACADGGCTDAGCGDTGCADIDAFPSSQPSNSSSLADALRSPPGNDSFSFVDASQGTVGNPSRIPGYIDSAIPQSQVRFRFDASYDFLAPDRAEFFYAACGCAGGPGPGNPPATPGAPAAVNGSLDAQEYTIYVESAVTEKFSWFIEMPFRSISPEANFFNNGVPPVVDTGSTSGLGDINAGLKLVLFDWEKTLVTFQFRVYAPTGDADQGLGTRHTSLEPALLLQHRASDRWTWFAEIRDWAPVGGTNLGSDGFAGNVLRYGVGTGLTIVDTCEWEVTPMVEFVGWTIFDGLQTTRPVAVVSAEGTIVNAKIGTRITKRHGITGRPNTMYVGYGRALTGDTWYQDILRVEYSILF